MKGYKLTTQQAEAIQGKEYAADCYFNPVLDVNSNYFIFDGEVDNCVNPNYMWVKDLPYEDYVAQQPNTLPV